MVRGSAEIICVGTELLLGEILNSNSQFLAQALAALGIPHYNQTVVGDNVQRLQQAVQVACDRAQLLIFTGGLGPTPDDLTTETLADFFNAPLVEHPEVIADIRQKFASRGYVPTENNFKQALLPAGAAVLPNGTGTAPGLIWEPKPGLLLMTFPGVPREMKQMWADTAVPYLQQNGWTSAQLVSRTLHFYGISESRLAEQVAPLFNQENPTVAPYAGAGQVRLRITAKADSPAAAAALLDPVERQIREIAGDYCFGRDGETLASVVGDRLKQRQETLAVAESCTGGGLGQMLTAVPGSSAYFWGGIISYDNSVKERLLGVDPTVLVELGAVSGPVAEQMAVGVRDRLQTTWGLSITGIAGPDGGTESKPVGLVYIGLAGPDGFVEAVECRLGDRRGRDWIRLLSACEALDRLRRQLR